MGTNSYKQFERVACLGHKVICTCQVGFLLSNGVGGRRHNNDGDGGNAPEMRGSDPADEAVTVQRRHFEIDNREDDASVAQ